MASKIARKIIRINEEISKEGTSFTGQEHSYPGSNDLYKRND